MEHNGVQPVGENVLTKDIRWYLSTVADERVSVARTDWAQVQRSVPARDDMGIRTGAECFCSQTRGQKIRN